MKEIRKVLSVFGILAVGLAGAVPAMRAAAETEEQPQCKAAYLCDYGSGTAVFEKNASLRLPVASMCNILTLLLSFDAIGRGELSYEEEIPISENAAGMGGSQVFLESGQSYPADSLLKSIAVCSANDSCVALAERICGSESRFVERMNERARDLGADNTLFANCTGLPKDPQYSCAKDIAVMLRALLAHEKYYEYAHVWLEDFEHPGGRTTQMTNTNRLIRSYSGCDGGKTGFTSQAGFCLAATAKRGATRLISVVIGAETSDARFQGVSAMLDDGFACYESKMLVRAGECVAEVPVRGSSAKTAKLCPERELTIFCRKGESGTIETEYILPESIMAPLEKGSCCGEAIVYRDGVEVTRCKLLNLAEIERFSWGDAFRELANEWNR